MQQSNNTISYIEITQFIIIECQEFIKGNERGWTDEDKKAAFDDERCGVVSCYKAARLYTLYQIRHFGIS